MRFKKMSLMLRGSLSFKKWEQVKILREIMEKKHKMALEIKT
jgi:hypothetical protein